ncbi:MAG: four helix bundle protein [Bacteroidia bacterium]|jgi:four helix bundle protein
MDLTRNLALQVMELTDHIPFRTSDNEIVKQITRSSNSVASNFRATRRAKSKADFLNKYKIVEEEADETIHFLFILKARFPALESSIVELTKAYEEFLAIVVKSIQSIRKSRNKQQ